ncbi:MAG: PKD domain-containing protein [Bacteroidota bacterium]
MPRYIKTILIFCLFMLCSPVAFAQVTANFTADHLTGCAPLIVHFTNTSTGATSYSWDLGNSTGSLVTHPSASYGTAGTYTVVLTAINGATTATHTAIITVYPVPVANFVANDTNVCPGVPVTFTSTSTAGMAGPMTYTWNFGDGVTSTATTPSHSYTTPGFYNITMYATNSGGCTQSITRTGHIEVYPLPVPAFSTPSPNVCTAPATMPFTNSTTGTAPLAYAWTFGDGGTAATPAPSRTYTLPGTYPVKLVATDGKGCKDSMTRTGYINIGNLDAAFTSPAGLCITDAITFTNTSSPHISQLWRFDDGTTATDENPEHFYTAPGTYNVKLIVFNGSCYDSVVHPLTVHPQPVTSFTVSPAAPCPPPALLTFTATIPAGSTAAWQYGDGGSGTGNPSTHNYTSAQIPTITLYTTDINGCKDTVSKLDTVNGLRVDVQSTSIAGCIPLATNLSALAVSRVLDWATMGFMEFPYPYTITGYSWNFGDGSPLSTSATPLHTYTATGVYLVTCTMTTANGCSKTGSLIIKAGTPPTSSFTATPSHVCVKKNITFTSTYTGTPDDFVWQFGDGDASSGLMPVAVHQYTLPGTHNVTLRTSFNGCQSTLFTLPVIVDSPIARGTFNYVCTPFTAVSFYDISSGATSRLWLFGDGDTSSAINPTHVYPSPTFYTPKLATYNATSGCRDTTSGPLGMLINLTPVNITVTPLDTTLCPWQPDTFSSTVSQSVAEYRWFVDGMFTGSTNDTLYYAFGTPGYHTVMLVIQDFRGCYDTLIKTNCVRVSNPDAVFTNTPSSGCDPLTVNFTDASTDLPGIAIVSRMMAYGDGSTEVLTAASVAHTYTAGGIYSPLEIITDAYGCTDFLEGPPITVNSPAAIFTSSSLTICVGGTADFTNASTGTTSYLWSFGDGATTTAYSPSHTYTAAGTYHIRLVGYSSLGCTDTLHMVMLVNPAPIAGFDMSDSFAVCPPLNVTFTNTSMGATAYSWAFGDGAFSVIEDPTNPYTIPGYYTVILTATNAAGCSSKDSAHVNLFGYSGAFTYAPVSGCSPLPVYFNAVLGNAAGIVWDFSDGIVSGSSLSDTISHVYTTPGGYIPKLILTDSFGCTNYSLGADTIKVDAVEPDFTITPNPSCATGEVAFADASFSYFSSVVTWSWTFGSTTSTIATPTHTYTTAGTYTVSLTATDGWGCTASTVKTVTVNPLPAAISGTASVCEGFTTTLASTSTGGTWMSDAPAVATISATGVVTGIAIGTTNITYTLPTGCITTKTVTVQAIPPTITGPAEVCLGTTVTLSNSAPGGTWSSSAPAIAPVSIAGVVAGNTVGVATITYTSTEGCYTTHDIAVNDVPSPITGIFELCVGAVVTFSNATLSGTWSSSAPAIASVSIFGQVNGISAGTAVITYTGPNNCYATTVVTINETASPIAGSLAVCAGFMENLTNPLMPGGMWTSGPPATVATIHPLTGVVTGVSPGNVLITYTVYGGCTVNAEVTVNPLPPAITGTPRVCIGAATLLANGSPGGAWSSSNPSAGIVDGLGIVTGINTGITIITYTIPTGCVNILAVSVNPLPLPLTGLDTVCEGSATLFATGSAGGAFSSGNAAVATAGLVSGVITGISAGNTLISYTFPGTGCFTTKAVTVHATPAAIGGADGVCIGATTTMIASLPGGLWTSSNPSIASIGSASGIVAGYVAGGVFTITYTLATGGCGRVKTMTVTPLPPVHNVTGGGAYCAGGNGVHVGLDGSDIGISYLLSYGASATGYATGTGSALDFGLLTVAGVYTVQATNAATGCKRNMAGSTTVTVTTPTIPVVNITGPGDTLCPGITYTFTATPVAGGGSLPVYQWRVNGMIVGSGSTYSFLPAGGDILSVKMTGSGCVAPDTAVSVHVLTVLPSAMPSVAMLIDPNDTLCQFTPTNFTAVPVYGGATPLYTWLVNGSAAGTASPFTYVPVNGDVIRVQMTSNYLCRLANVVTSADITLTVDSLATPHVTIIPTPGVNVHTGDVVTLNAIVTDAGPSPLYQWQVNGVPVPGATNTSYTSTFNHFDSVSCVVTSNGICPNISGFDWVFITVSPLGVVTASTGHSDVQLLPNPSTGTFTIKGTLPTASNKPVRIEVTDMLGQKVFTSEIAATGGKIDQQVTLSNTLANGVYMVRLTGESIGKAFHLVIRK